MKFSDVYVSQLDAEAVRTRRMLEHAPAGLDGWKPSEKSMPFDRLAMLVARMPTWFSLIVGQDELELAPASGSNVNQTSLRDAGELVRAHDEGVNAAREALSGASDEHLMKPWRLLVNGHVVSEQPRHVVIRETFTHLAHHRGQLTVYYRLRNVNVPSVYGPSADDQTFA